MMAVCAVQFAAAEVCTVLDVYNESRDACTLDLDCPQSGKITKNVHGKNYSVGEEVTI